MFVNIKDFPIKSLNRTRDLIIYLPDDYYYTDERYPVLYVQDGQNAFFDEASYSKVSWGFVEAMQQLDLKLIVVAIPCGKGYQGRMDEYGPWPICDELVNLEDDTVDHIGGEGIQYVDWMADVLKPYIDRRFRTIPNDSCVIGSSMGGVIVAYATLYRSDAFNKCAALSTAYWFYMDEFKELIENANYSQIDKYYMDFGEFEGCGDSEVDEWYIESNNEIASLLQNKIKCFESRYMPTCSHNEGEWRKRIPYILEFLYRR